jgi:Inositol hexakisphosphate
VEESWELLHTPSESAVHTTKELINSLTEKYKCRVKYARVPITPESTPEVRDFDDMVKLVANVPPSTHIVFSCQMGRGRSTTGMLVASLIRQWISHPKRGPVFHKIKKSSGMMVTIGTSASHSCVLRLCVL